MNIYQVSTGCYSDFAHTILVSEKSLSADEFSALCKEISKDICRSDDCWRNEEEIVKVLMEKHGFRKPRIVSCHFWDYSFHETDEDSFVANEDSGS